MITKWLRKKWRQEIVHTTAFSIDPAQEKLLLFVELNDEMVSPEEMNSTKKHCEEMIAERTGLDVTAIVVRNGNFKFVKVKK